MKPSTSSRAQSCSSAPAAFTRLSCATCECMRRERYCNTNPALKQSSSSRSLQQRAGSDYQTNVRYV